MGLVPLPSASLRLGFLGVTWSGSSCCMASWIQYLLCDASVAVDETYVSSSVLPLRYMAGPAYYQSRDLDREIPAAMVFGTWRVLQNTRLCTAQIRIITSAYQFLVYGEELKNLWRCGSIHPCSDGGSRASEFTAPPVNSNGIRGSCSLYTYTGGFLDHGCHVEAGGVRQV